MKLTKAEIIVIREILKCKSLWFPILLFVTFLY